MFHLSVSFVGEYTYALLSGVCLLFGSGRGESLDIARYSHISVTI
jgi:hypothetical protein